LRVIVVGGSSRNVGKTTLAAALIAGTSGSRTAAMKVSVRESPCATAVRVMRDASAVDRHHDAETLLAAGAFVVIWVTVHRPSVRAGLAAGLRAARALRPATVVIESTSAGIELRRIDESFFVAGDDAWKPWAERHRARADSVVHSREVFKASSRQASPSTRSG
jgi:hypothetical protein